MMKKMILTVIAALLPLVFTCGPLLADRAQEAKGGGAPQPSDARAPLRDALEEMTLSTGRVAMKDTAGTYFVAAMAPYCQAAVELAAQAARFSADADLVWTASEKSAGDRLLLRRMETWRKSHVQPAPELSFSSARSFVNLMEEVRQETREDIETALSDRDPERSYVSVMIAYGQGAVDMAKVVLIFEGDRELRNIAQEAIGLQQAGVLSMKPFLKKGGVEARRQSLTP